MKKMVVCPRCKGRGMIGKIVPNILTGKGAIFADYECDCCKGEGQVSEKKAESWIKRNTSVGEQVVKHNEQLAISTMDYVDDYTV